MKCLCFTSHVGEAFTSRGRLVGGAGIE